ncbi:O-antigen/teichoic acid export membrane protein [Kocuria rosea]|nr:O-antigen/teichoic acid export membrane protein [Kocuria rosea]
MRKGRLRDVGRSSAASSVVLVIRVGGALLQMSLVATVALRFSPYEVGLNGVLWSVALVARMTGAMGLETLGLKMQAPLWAKGNSQAASSLALRDFRVLFIGWSCLALLVGLVALAGGLAYGWPGWWMVALVLVAANSGVHRLLVLQLQAKDQPIFGQFTESIVLPGLALVAALLAATFVPEHFITLQVVPFVLVSILLYFASPCFRCREDPSGERIVWRTALVMAAGSLLTSLTSRAPIFFLGMNSLAIAGTYDIALRIQSVGTLGTSAVTTVYLAKISVALHQARTLVRFIVEAAILSLPIPAFLLVFFVAVGQDGLVSILGPEYSGAWSAAILLVVASIINAVTSAMSHVLILAERERMYLCICAAQIFLVIGGAVLFDANTAAEMAVWVLMGEMLRSMAMVVGFIVYWRVLSTQSRQKMRVRT